MARSCGIHIGRRRFELVVLDGSAKKPKVVHQASGEIPIADDPISATAQVLREAAKGVKVPGDNIGLAIDSGLAAYRTLTLPFDDRSKIEDVVKFEIENKLPQWDIDDVIVDFLVMSSTPGVESNLLVTAVPKDRLAARLRACERAGLEAFEAELDTTAIFNAAHQTGILDGDAAQILVHVGDSSTSVVIVDGGELRAMRAIQTGASQAPSAADPLGLEAEEGAEAPPQEAHDPGELLARQKEAARRIRRELGRTISGAATQNPIETVYVTGLQLPGLVGEAIQDVPVEPLRVLPDGDPLGEGECAVAYGAALRRLGGGVLTGRLRREELRYSGKFERLELPLAVASLLLLTVLLVHFIVLTKQIVWRGGGAEEHRGDLQIWLEASNQYMLPIPDIDYPGRLTNPPENIANYAKLAQDGGDHQRTKYEQLNWISNMLQREIVDLKRQLGQISEVVQPQSALEGMTLVLEVIDEMDEDIGRVALRSLDANYMQGRGTSEDYILVKLDMDFFDEDTSQATFRYNRFQSRIQEMPWCLEFEQRGTKVMDDNQGIFVDGVAIHVNVAAAPEEKEG